MRAVKRKEMETYEPVAFVSIEAGDDLIVSFFVTRSDDPSDGRSLTLLRTLKWEYLLPDWERGVKVSDESLPNEEEWQENFLEQIRLSESTVELKSTLYERKLDVRRLDPDRYAAHKGDRNPMRDGGFGPRRPSRVTEHEKVSGTRPLILRGIA